MNILQRIVCWVINEAVEQIQREDKEHDLIYEIDSVPLVALARYIPLSQAKGNDETKYGEIPREVLWAFKDGDVSDENYQKVFDIVVDAFCTIITGEYGDEVDDITLVCIPASNQKSTAKRWKNFMAALAGKTGCKNGFKHVKAVGDNVPRHFAGRGKARPINIDKKFFAGKKIIIIDDLVNTGNTMHQAIKHFKQAGAEVMCSLAIAHT